MDVDFAGAKQYAFHRLRNLPPYLVYHNLKHTRESVLPAAIEFAVFSGINGENLLLLQTAAVYHDIGFVERSTGHEEASVKSAIKTLPRFGYNPIQIDTVTEIILATKLPQTPKDFLGQLLADADLEVLGTDAFFEATHCLRLEREAEGVYQTDEDWYRGQIEFLEKHSYFTAAANSLRTEKKWKNLEGLKNLLGQLTDI